MFEGALVEGGRSDFKKKIHQRASGGKRKNTICMLKDGNEVEHIDDEAVGVVDMDYFKSMFSSSE